MSRAIHPGRPDERTMLTDPVRYPESAPSGIRTKRAFLLLLLTLVLPGAAQVVAGDRRLGRRALRVTFTVWLLVIAAVVLALTNRTLLVSLLTNEVFSLLLIAVLVVLAVGWALLFLNTLRIIRPPLLDRGMRPAVAASLAVLMILTSGGLGYAAYLLNVGRSTFGNIFQAGPAFDPVDGRYNFLLMGGDAGEDRLGRRPDSISVVSVDAATGATVTFSIPRDFQNAPFSEGSPLWQVWPDGYNCGNECIINSLYPVVSQEYADLYPESQDPGAEAMMDAASGILGIEVQAYILVDMAGFEQLIDAMGGIRIDAGGWVPITSTEIPGTSPKRYNPPSAWIEPGVQTLSGYEALWYARSREYATDYSRIQRQQCVQAAMIAQLDPATVLTRFQEIAAAGTQIVETDLPRDQLGSFVDLALKAKNHDVGRLTIGAPDFGEPGDLFSTYPNIPLVHERVQETLNAASGEAAAAGSLEVDRAGLVEALPSQTVLPAQNVLPSQTVLPSRTVLPAQNVQGEITVDYLHQLAVNQDWTTLESLLADNGECSPA
ncbi:LCP family protein [uncultured Arthrobacter sp.]|uniref:LCP family protein n=1 Tax=uncultured Arthrobacter sp. TaxID=114050 RepID=UPI002622BFDE|nr:LCP family protein [uncultured Arthrobacter sp.]